MFDLTVFETIFSLAHQSAFLDWLIVLFGRWWELVIAAGVIVYVLWGKKDEPERKKRAVNTLWALGSALIARFIITAGIRFLVPRDRPFAELGIESLFDHAANASFPSGHATFFMALAVYFLLIGGKREQTFGWFLFVSAILIGIARVATGIHWPTDVLAGWAGGALIGAFGWYLARRAQRNKNPETI